MQERFYRITERTDDAGSGLTFCVAELRHGRGAPFGPVATHAVGWVIPPAGRLDNVRCHASAEAALADYDRRRPRGGVYARGDDPAAFAAYGMARDWQRERVYRWEDRCLAVLAPGALGETASLDDAAEIAAEVASWFGAPPPAVSLGHASLATSSALGRSITMAHDRGRVRTAVLVHEAVHAAFPRAVPAHGPLFAAALALALGRRFGFDPEDAVRLAAEEGVSVLPLERVDLGLAPSARPGR